MEKIFLVGFMGSGKTTVGLLLAKSLGLKFLDTDEAIEQIESKKIADIFSTRGEAYFRELESKLLREITGQKNAMVISTGGGMPCFGGNLEAMQMAGQVIYVRRSFHAIFSTIVGDPKRPLAVHSTKKELYRLYRQRRTFYEKAGLCIRNRGNTNQVVEKLIAGLRNRYTSQ
ncbi:MAG: shikimate kinase [Saprospiraceae bacterium]|nr:shikimate kinase [Saprospiraceae bacterium]